jgi:hypothetical protein
MTSRHTATNTECPECPAIQTRMDAIGETIVRIETAQTEKWTQQDKRNRGYYSNMKELERGITELKIELLKSQNDLRVMLEKRLKTVLKRVGWGTLAGAVSGSFLFAVLQYLITK